ncbi:hypothetical protein JCM8547_002029 [Rhodosporidiobolus lusitaniae]
MPNLRSRRPYRASDGDEDEAAPVILDPQVLASGFRLFLTLASSVKPTQIDLAILALASLAGLAVLTLSLDTAEKLMWGLAPVGAVLLSLLVQHDAHRALLEAEDLKKLMYNAPEA